MCIAAAVRICCTLQLLCSVKLPCCCVPETKTVYIVCVMHALMQSGVLHTIVLPAHSIEGH